jgi:hypothetical protein
VVLFGPAPIEEWGPPEDGPHRALTVADLRRGDPFADEPDPALLGVTVADVLDAVTDVLAPRASAPVGSGAGWAGPSTTGRTEP